MDIMKVQEKRKAEAMEIIWKGYKITRDRYQWILSLKSVVTQDVIDRAKKIHGDKVKSKIGEVVWHDDSFFSHLDTLMETIIRHETGEMKSDVGMADFLVLWYDILKGFEEKLEIGFNKGDDMSKITKEK